MHVPHHRGGGLSVVADMLTPSGTEGSSRPRPSSLWGSPVSDFCNRNVRLIHAVSAGLWVAGLCLIVLNMAGVWSVADLGIYCTCAGGVLSIRGYMGSLHEREIRAFHLGQDSVRQIRSR